MSLIKVDWDNFKFRCHYFGQLMSPAKGKSNIERYNEVLEKHDVLYNRIVLMNDGPAKDKAILKIIELDKTVQKLALIKDKPTFSATCKKRLVQIYTEQTTGRTKDIESVYLEKGLSTEEDSITLYSLRTGNMYRKNKEPVSNDYVSGEIDFDDEDQNMIIDVKSTWDIFTFDEKILLGITHDYKWQGTCYMWLKNRKRFRLAYCLNNTPKEILSRMERKLQYNMFGSDEDVKEACRLLREKHTYDDLPLERKIRIFEMSRDEEMIETAKSYIPHFREYLKNITDSKIEEDEKEYISEETE